MNKFLMMALTLLSTVMAFANEVEHAATEHEAIPLDKIGWQAANLGILIVIIFYFARKSIVEMFAKRRTDYIEQSEKTKTLLIRAEAELKEIKTKLAQLESGENNAFETAQHEANLIKSNLIKDSEAQAVKMKNDAAAAIQNELLKAKAEINQIILAEAVVSAKQKLAEAGPQSQKAIETQFLSQVDKASIAGASV